LLEIYNFGNFVSTTTATAAATTIATITAETTTGIATLSQHKLEPEFGCSKAMR